MKKKYILLVKHAPKCFYLSLKTLILDFPWKKLFLTIKQRYILSGPKCRLAHIVLGPPIRPICPYMQNYFIVYQ